MQWKKGRDRVGKVCFFHVPGEADEENVQKGVRVAEAAIRSVVGSWEEGMRREGKIVEGEEELGESQEEERERKTGR